MSWSGKKFATFATATLLTALSALPARLNAQDAALRLDQQAYCDYVSQQAMAQRDLLRSPSAISGVTQATAALPVQMFWGLTSSLSDIKKAGLTMDVARKKLRALYGHELIAAGGSLRPA